jgi:hypothetical protein
MIIYSGAESKAKKEEKREDQEAYKKGTEN